MQHGYRLTLRLAHRIGALAALICFMFAAAAAPMAPNAPLNLLILGDSLTAGYGLPASAGFQARLSAALRAQGQKITLIDGAVSGDTTSDAAARLDWVLAGGPVNAAIVELGGNDALRGLDPATMRKNLTYILNVLAARHIPVLLTGMIALASYGADYQARFHAVFTTLGTRPGVIFDPFFLAGLPGHPNLVQSDGLHPNAAGVSIEVTRLLPSVQRLLALAKYPPTDRLLSSQP